MPAQLPQSKDGKSMPRLLNDFSAMSEEDVARLAALDLPSPTEDELSHFLTQQQQQQQYAPKHRPIAEVVEPHASSDEAGTSTDHNSSAMAAVERPVTARLRRQADAGAATRLGGMLSASASFITEVVPGADLSASRPGTAARRAPGGVADDVDDTDVFATTEDYDSAYNAALSVLSKGCLVGGPEAVAEAMMEVRHVELIGCQLRTTRAAEFFLNATHLYLPHNSLRSLAGLQLLTHLQVLVVHHNELESLRDVATMDQLIYLDARYNDIATLNAAWDLPCSSLQYLNLIGNPCCPADSDAVTDATRAGEENAEQEEGGYREQILSACTQLRSLDDQPCGESSDDNGGDASTDASVGEDTSRRSATPSLQRGSSSIRGQGASAAAAAATAHPLPPAPSALAEADRPRSRLKDRLQQARLHSTSQQGHRSEGSSGKSSPAPSQSLGNPPIAEQLLRQYESAVTQHRTRQAAKTRTSVGLLEGESASNAVSAGSTQRPSSSPQPGVPVRPSAHVQRLHNDLNYATAAAQRRQQQIVADQWAAVDKVIQTRHAVVEERRRRLRELPTTKSAAYQRSLELLADEGVSKDLDTYRRAQSQSKKPDQA